MRQQVSNSGYFSMNCLETFCRSHCGMVPRFILRAVNMLTFTAWAANSRASHEEGWGQGATMPIALGEVGAAVVDGVLYVAGFGSAKVAAYDLVTETWAPTDAIPPRPQPGHHHGAQSLGNKLYLIGGGGGAEGKLQIYVNQCT